MVRHSHGALNRTNSKCTIPLHAPRTPSLRFSISTPCAEIIATGILHDADKPWETFAGRESGGLRGKGGAAPVIAGLLDVPDSPREDRYKGLTPPISPAQVGMDVGSQYGSRSVEGQDIPALV